jgi:hypothetical protein
MPRCRECNLIVNAAAEYCPRCGTPVPTRSRDLKRGVLVVAVLLFILFIALRNGGNGETAPTKASPVSVSNPFQVAIEASVSGSARPTVTGTTNLPNGTQLMVWLEKPWLPDGKERVAASLPACGDDDCFPLQTYTKLPNDGGFGVLVKNGRFSDGPFTYKEAAPRPGNYVLVVSSFFAALQPADVRAIIGELGENMTGPLVGGCCFGSHMDHAEIQKELDKERSSVPTLGASIYYARYVEIGPPQQSNAIPSTAHTAAPPIGAIGDRYPEAEHQHQTRQVDTLLNYVRVVYFALGCKVFYPEFENTEGIANILINTAYIGLKFPKIPPGELTKAKSEGAARASREGCGFWREHPQAVYEMRRAVDASLRAAVP